MPRELIEKQWRSIAGSTPLQEGCVRTAACGEVAYVAAGNPEGPCIFLLHGVPQFWYAWRWHITKLAEAGYFVVAPDLPGMHRSARLEDWRAYRLENVAAAIAQVIQEVSPSGTAGLAGHDFGGLIAYSVAAYHPERVRRLVVLDAAHPILWRRSLRDPGRIRQIIRSLYAMQFAYAGDIADAVTRATGIHTSLRMRAFRWSIFNRRAPRNPAVFPDVDIEIYAHALGVRGGLRCMMRYYEAIFKTLIYNGSPADPPFPLIHTPMRVVFGSEDGYLEPGLFTDEDTLRPLAPGLQGVRLLPGVSHWTLEESPDLVYEELIQMFSAGAQSASAG